MNATSTNRSSGPGTGSGVSTMRRTSGPPRSVSTTAFTAWPRRRVGRARARRAQRWRRDEHTLAVVLQLVDRVANVVEGAVRTLLLGPILADLRVPAPHQLLQAGHVDRAVVQVRLDVGQVRGEEATIGPDRVAAQRHGAGRGDVLADEVQGGRPRLLQRHGRGADRVEQPRAGVHADDERVHPAEHVVGLVDHEIGAFRNDRQLVVGDDRGDLDDHIPVVIQPGHLEIHPHQHGSIVGERTARRPVRGRWAPSVRSAPSWLVVRTLRGAAPSSSLRWRRRQRGATRSPTTTATSSSTLVPLPTVDDRRGHSTSTPASTPGSVATPTTTLAEQPVGEWDGAKFDIGRITSVGTTDDGGYPHHRLRPVLVPPPVPRGDRRGRTPAGAAPGLVAGRALGQQQPWDPSVRAGPRCRGADAVRRWPGGGLCRARPRPVARRRCGSWSDPSALEGLAADAPLALLTFAPTGPVTRIRFTHGC